MMLRTCKKLKGGSLPNVWSGLVWVRTIAPFTFYGRPLSLQDREISRSFSFRWWELQLFDSCVGSLSLLHGYQFKCTPTPTLNIHSLKQQDLSAIKPSCRVIIHWAKNVQINQCVHGDGLAVLRLCGCGLLLTVHSESSYLDSWSYARAVQSARWDSTVMAHWHCNLDLKSSSIFSSFRPASLWRKSWNVIVMESVSILAWCTIGHG